MLNLKAWQVSFKFGSVEDCVIVYGETKAIAIQEAKGKVEELANIYSKVKQDSFKVISRRELPDGKWFDWDED